MSDQKNSLRLKDLFHLTTASAFTLALWIWLIKMAVNPDEFVQAIDSFGLSAVYLVLLACTLGIFAFPIFIIGGAAVLLWIFEVRFKLYFLLLASVTAYLSVRFALKVGKACAYQLAYMQMDFAGC